MSRPTPLTKEQIVESAKWLEHSVPMDTVIDPNWWDYMYNTPVIWHLMVVTGRDSYETILNDFEGQTIEELLETFEQEWDVPILRETKNYDVGWSVEISGVETVQAKDFNEARDKVESDLLDNIEQYIDGKPRDVRTYKN